MASKLNLKPKKFTIRTYGIQSRIVRRTGICAPVICNIWKGNRKPTPEQAKKLEEALLHYGIDITCFNLLYDVRHGESLPDYYDRKFGKD